jgi:hypothetical protein
VIIGAGIPGYSAHGLKTPALAEAFGIEDLILFTLFPLKGNSPARLQVTPEAWAFST